MNSGEPHAGVHDHSLRVPSLERNLDALDHMLTEAETTLERALGDEDYDLRAIGEIAHSERHASYEELSSANEALGAQLGWQQRQLDELLTEEQRQQLDEWQAAKRLSWTSEDVLLVGFAASIGIAATLMDTQVDAAIRTSLGRLSDAPLFRRWEREASRLPIDYTGTGFGGAGHRVRSSGHDVGRPFSALRQIRDGVFRGSLHMDGQERKFTTPEGAYSPIPELGAALVVWAKHLVTDVVTPMSLPLPGWTWLSELSTDRLRELAIDMYRGPTPGEGLNVRSGLISPALSVLAVESIVRPAVHARFYQSNGVKALPIAEKARLNELLLASHSLVGAACLGKTLTTALTGEGPFSLRHLNLPVLIRIGRLAAQVRSRAHMRDQLAPPSWDELLASVSSPWLLDDAARIEDLFSRGLPD